MCWIILEHFWKVGWRITGLQLSVYFGIFCALMVFLEKHQFLRSILILSLHVRSDVPNGLFDSSSLELWNVICTYSVGFPPQRTLQN